MRTRDQESFIVLHPDDPHGMLRVVIGKSFWGYLADVDEVGLPVTDVEIERHGPRVGRGR
jgi:hypothetical protein